MNEFESGTTEGTERTAGIEGTARTEGTEATEGTEGASQLPLWPEEPEAAAPVCPPEPPDPPWTLADLGFLVLFAGFVALPLANLVVIGGFLALRRSFDWELTVEQAFTRTPFVVSMQTGWEVLWLVFIYLTITSKYRRQFWQAIKWTRGPHPWATYLVGGAALALLAQLLFYLSPTEKELPIERLFTSPAAGYLLTVFGICVAPFVEELVFRGFFYPVFERLWGFVAAVLLTALLFALIHASQLWGGWQEIAAIFFVGLTLSYFRGKTGSLVPSFLMHLAYNTALFVSLYFSTDGFRALKG